MTGDVFGFFAPRVCRIRSENALMQDMAALQSEPFRSGVEAMAADGEALSAGALARPEVVSAVGAMVVLGEPGAGKTSMLRGLTSTLPRVEDIWDQAFDGCLWVTGGDLTEASYHEELGRHLDALPTAGQAPGIGAGALTVVLDQTDESPLRPSLPRRLQKALRNKDTNRIRILMACRTADYPAPMTAVLSEALGACHCVDLAPLSRQEAVALADSAAEVNGEELVKAAEAAGAAVLASVPLTLELLVMTYRKDGQLRGSAEHLFARGVHCLVEEPDRNRLSRQVATTAPQRLQVAGRIAAWMMLSGRRSVWCGSGLTAGDFDLPDGILAGGREGAAAGSFDVTPQVLQETLATALFAGPDGKRTAFRHSSVAAYLAARYLTTRHTTQQQLRNLLLVGTPAGVTRSVPPPLRETAAWLVAMNPTDTDWLAEADPESLAVHSALVRSDEVRRLTVARLLERAAQVELGDTRWELARWDLRHPRLADQLTQALTSLPSGSADEWQIRARIRVIVRLAQTAGSAHPDLADALLHVAESDSWHQTERRLAARAAFDCDADRAAPVLKKILTSLAAPEAAERLDPDNDLRGTVLTLLWPQYLDVQTTLAALRPSKPFIHGTNAYFLTSLPRSCRDEQLSDLLSWAKSAVHQTRSETDFSFKPHTNETTLIDGLINRALSSTDAVKHLDAVAKILLRILREHFKAQLPTCFQPDNQGNETAQIQSQRRLLAKSLIEEAARQQLPPREAAWLIVHDWEVPTAQRWDIFAAQPVPFVRHKLVDAQDFMWAMQQVEKAASETDGSLVAAYGELAAGLFPQEDQEAFTLAYDHEHPAWPYLSPYYEPMRLGSPLVESLRRSHRVREAVWPHVDEFAAKLAYLLASAREGDNSSLCQLVWGLRTDPGTGRVESPGGPLQSWPAAALLSDDLSDLSDLALRYLNHENDRADSWINGSIGNRWSWTGYVLLVELHREGRLDGIADVAWGSWAGAVLTTILGFSTSYREPIRRDLTRIVAQHAPEALARRIAQHVSSTLAQGHEPLQLAMIDPRWSQSLRTTLEVLSLKLSAALGIAILTPAEVEQENIVLTIPDTDEATHAAWRAWRALLVPLLNADSTIARNIIDVALPASQATLQDETAAIQAACALLAADAEANWPRVKKFAEASPGFGRQLVKGCVHTEIPDRMRNSLDEAEVAALYTWLDNLYPVGQFGTSLQFGVSEVTLEQEAREWADSLPRELSRRANEEAVKQLKRLADRHPEQLSLAAALLTATAQHAAASWTRVRPEEIMHVLQDPSLRVIRTSSDLLDVVSEVLGQVEVDLPPHGELLWDRKEGSRPQRKSSSRQPATAPDAAPDTWRPKPEAALCAYLAHELTLRLGGHRVTVNREVLIQPTDAYGAGDRTDILIDAQGAGDNYSDGAFVKPLKLVIEVKGAWNPKLSSAQEEQLAGRYLPEAMTDVGIYLVGWYPLELWTAEMGTRRRNAAKKWQADTLLVHLQKQAAQLGSVEPIHIRPVVIRIPHPHAPMATS
ncbi:NACHT domain-containing protein [Streptomyces microflavus]|uniref:NACHT domain-containing protein n=1 Tax=Streptomyces microflavus TaxID=1919 RepID=UPI0035E07C45